MVRLPGARALTWPGSSEKNEPRFWSTTPVSPAHARPSQPAAPAGGDTIALVTADREGNAVSLIQSLYFTFGSGVMAGDTGVVLQNRGSFFSLDPGHVNALAPGKRTM